MQWVSSTFSPRLILFRRSPLPAWTIAVAVALFSFSISAAVRAGTKPTVPALVPLIAGLGTLVVIAMIWRVQIHALAPDHAGPVRDAAALDADVRRAVVAGTDRTFDQDPAFALRLLVSSSSAISRSIRSRTVRVVVPVRDRRPTSSREDLTRHG